MSDRELLLEVRGFSVSFSRYRGLHRTRLPAIRDLHLRVKQGELVAVVGSSGSGKSLLAHGILGILPYNAVAGGELLYRGEALTARRAEKLRGREIVLVPQSVSFLDPLMRVGGQVRGAGGNSTAKGERARALLGRYGLEQGVQRSYPFQLSGGMTRRVLIATALMENPRLVIADEPTPGLHRPIARRVLGHFREIADEGAGVLLITHDLELALEVADRIVVFYAGTTVEEAPAAAFGGEETLCHPYTRALWRAMPRNGFTPLEGVQPYPGQVESGCAFAPRCPRAGAECGGEVPYRRFGDRGVRCLCPEGGGLP